jgi:hypothetical protein
MRVQNDNPCLETPLGPRVKKIPSQEERGTQTEAETAFASPGSRSNRVSPLRRRLGVRGLRAGVQPDRFWTKDGI